MWCFCVCLDFGRELYCVLTVLGNMRWKRCVCSFPILFGNKVFIFFCNYYCYIWMSVAILFLFPSLLGLLLCHPSQALIPELREAYLVNTMVLVCRPGLTVCISYSQLGWQIWELHPCLQPLTALS